MASFAKLTSLLLLSVLFIQIHARESNFFSKVPNTVENFDAKETQIPDKIDPAALTKKENTPQDQEPNFIPQTQNNGYGLYGHESGQLPPSATKFSDPKPFTTTPNYHYDTFKSDLPNYRTESKEYYNNDNNDDDNEKKNFQNSNSKLYDNSFYYNKDLYEGRRQSFGDVKLSRDDFTTTPLYDQQNTRNYYPSNGGDNVVGRQGMSDTRFMENGKYYYDLNNEPHHYRSPRSRNNDRGYFGNNGNNFEYSNSMEGYQNDEAEFQEEPNEFVP